MVVIVVVVVVVAAAELEAPAWMVKRGFGGEKGQTFHELCSVLCQPRSSRQNLAARGACDLVSFIFRCHSGDLHDTVGQSQTRD